MTKILKFMPSYFQVFFCWRYQNLQEFTHQKNRPKRVQIIAIPVSHKINLAYGQHQPFIRLLVRTVCLKMAYSSQTLGSILVLTVEVSKIVSQAVFLLSRLNCVSGVATPKAGCSGMVSTRFLSPPLRGHFALIPESPLTKTSLSTSPP